MLNWKERLTLKLDAAGDNQGGGQGTGDQNAADKQPDGDKSQEGEGDKKDEDKLDVSQLPKSAQDLIKSLRDENAKHRTKNKEIGSKNEKLLKALVEAGVIEADDEEPEVKLKTVSQKAQEAELRAAMLETAVEYSIPKDSLDYFQFLLNKALDGLEDGEELTEEQVEEIAKKVKQQTQGAGAKNTSVGSGKSGAAGAPPPGGDKSTVTLDQFTKMNIGEKSALYQKSPETYNKLLAEAKTRKVLV